MKKVQTQLLVSPRTRDRVDAIAIAITEPRAEVLRNALEGGGLRAVERTYAAELEKLDGIAEVMGLSRFELAQRATKDKLTLKDLEGRRRYPVKS